MQEAQEELGDAAKDLPNFFERQASKHNGFLLGEDHTNKSSKTWLTSHMKEMKDNGIHTLYVEHFFVGNEQRLINEYLSSEKGLDVFPPALQKILRQSNVDGFSEVLRAAKENGMRVVGIGSNLSQYSNGYDRALLFNQNAAEIIKKDQENLEKRNQKTGFVVLAGEAHLCWREGKEPLKPIRGLAQILDMQAVTLENDVPKIITNQIVLDDTSKMGITDYVINNQKMPETFDGRISQEAMNIMTGYLTDDKSLSKAGKIIEKTTGISVLKDGNEIDTNEVLRVLGNLYINGAKLVDVVKEDNGTINYEKAIRETANHLAEYFNPDQKLGNVIHFSSEGEYIPLTFTPNVTKVHFYSSKATREKAGREEEEKAKWEERNNKAKMICDAHNEQRGVTKEKTNFKMLKKEDDEAQTKQNGNQELGGGQKRRGKSKNNKKLTDNKNFNNGLKKSHP